MANQLDLYIMESKKHEQSGNVEMELYAELQKISASSNTGQQITEKEAQSGADELNRAISNAAEKATETIQDALQNAEAAKQRFINFQHSNTAHNWWLALIAFLLFLHLCFKN